MIKFRHIIEKCSLITENLNYFIDILLSRNTRRIFSECQTHFIPSTASDKSDNVIFLN